MRVIAGKARRLALKTVPGMETRPTTDRIKETLFNILQPEIPDCRFLDLFSGSGGIGIEALSRGAESAVFVEKNPKACTCIRENLTFTKLAEMCIRDRSRTLGKTAQSISSAENVSITGLRILRSPCLLYTSRCV